MEKYGRTMTRVGKDVNRMKDYPDRMTPEQASFGGMAESFKDGGKDIEIYARGGASALSSGGE